MTEKKDGQKEQKKFSVYVRSGVREMKAEAKRQGRTVGWVIEKAWRLSRDRIRAMPGEDD